MRKQSPNYTNLKNIILSLSIILLFGMMEFYFSDLSKHTFQAIFSGLFFLVTIMSLLLFFILFNVHYRKLSLVFLLIGFFVVVPLNMYFQNQLDQVKSQSDEIVHYAFQEKIKTGEFPKKINIKSDKRIFYCQEDKNLFTLSFYIVDPNIGHFYSSKDGWGFMDD